MSGNNMQLVFAALHDLGRPVTLDDVRNALAPLHHRSVEDALRGLVRGGYVCARYELVDGAAPPIDRRGRKKRGGAHRGTR